MKVNVNTFSRLTATFNARGETSTNWVDIFVEGEPVFELSVFGSQYYCQALADAINGLSATADPGEPITPPTRTDPDDEVPF